LRAASKGATHSPGAAARLQQHLLASLLCPERLTLTNLICTSGGQHADWTADYRLYSRGRVESDALFASVRSALEAQLPADRPLVVAVDDTLVRKSGTKIAGVRWMRDPLGPAFQTNLVRGQRYVQFSAAWPLAAGAARMVPIGFHHAPGAPKPPKALAADAAAQAFHRAERARLSLTAQTLTHLKTLRAALPAGRKIVFAGDGGFTNARILKGLPEGTTYLGRMRKDAVLHHPPAPKKPGGKGRKLSYGEVAPTPEALLGDEKIPWRHVEAFAAGKRHRFKIKTMAPVLWRKAGADKKLRIIVIAPLGYRLRKGSKLLYRQPAYLLCTDPEMPLAEALQDYLWRWGIEVNFREEKSLIGTGDAQVRDEASNEHQPAMTVAAYSQLWVAALTLQSEGNPLTPLRAPKWRARKDQPIAPATGELLRLLRYEYWASALRPAHFYHFETGTPPDTSAEKCTPDLPATLLCAA
jgi:DDE superfamily endonuclease